MPKLFEITDAYTPEETIDGLPVEPVLPTERPRVIINTAEFDKPKPDPLWDDVEGFKNKVKSGVSGIGDAIKYASELDQKFTSSIVNFPKKAYENSDDLIKGIKNLFGLGEEERYQLWPEKVVKEALTSAGDIAKPNPYPEGSEQWQFYEDKRQEGMVPAAMAISALAGSGGLAGTGAKAGEVALGATPFLRPALRHKDRLYKGKLGQEHQDIIPKELYEDFSRKAMSGEDLAEYNFGFINDKGHFLDREKALKYGIDTGIIDPHSGKFGALTTTLMADSSKPGTAIEAMAKTKFDFKPGESSGSRSVKLGPTEITYGVNPKNNDVELSLIRTDKNKRGEGSARAATEQFLAEADANGKRVLLNADPMDKSTSKAKLEDFYKSLGFVRNSGRNKDFTTRAEYIRDPVLKADSSKPGMAIEAAAKTRTLIPAMKIGDKIYKGKPGDEHIDIINKNRLGLDDFEEGLGDNRFGFINHKGQFLNREKAMEYAKNNDLVKSRSKLLTSAMLLADSSKPGTAIEAMAKANPFYSAVEHTVKNIPQSKMTGEQWLGTIANKPGVKGEELDWTGLKSFLEENKGKPVTKAQIEEHLAANKVELKEVSKGGDATPEQAFALAKEHGWQSWDAIDPATQAKYLARVSKEAGDNPTKYHKYQLPGGENYREMLLTLPEKAGSKLTKAQEDLIKVYKQEYGDNWKDYLSPSQSEELGLLKADKNNYRSSHWDEPNILAHVRMNDRNIDGKKSLHLEEIQSDWHQQGRDKGYRNEGRTKQVIQKELDGLLGELRNRTGEYLPTDKHWAEHKDISAKFDALSKELKAAKNGSEGVPDAPFKKSWHELALKRMIREAAEKGYDRLSWTPGEAQAARYSLEKQLKELQYLKNDDGTYSIAGVTKDGGGFNHPENVTADKLPNIVGKEMAEKIIKNEGKRARGHPANGGYFEGVDLKVGGEGMKGFYDQIIPKAVEKLTGQKVQAGSVNDKYILKNKYGHTARGGATKAEAEKELILKNRHMGDESWKIEKESNPIHYIEITPELKQKALQKGFPLFSNAHPGYTFIPYAGNPFENKQ